MNRDQIRSQLRSVAGIFRTLDLIEEKTRLSPKAPRMAMLSSIEGMRATMRRYRESLTQQLKP